MEKVIQRQERKKKRKGWERPGKKGRETRRALGVGGAGPGPPHTESWASKLCQALSEKAFI